MLQINCKRKDALRNKDIIIYKEDIVKLFRKRIHLDLSQFKLILDISINIKKIITLVIIGGGGLLDFFVGVGEELLIFHPSFCVYDLIDYLRFDYF